MEELESVLMEAVRDANHTARMTGYAYEPEDILGEKIREHLSAYYNTSYVTVTFLKRGWYGRVEMGNCTLFLEGDYNWFLWGDGRYVIKAWLLNASMNCGEEQG